MEYLAEKYSICQHSHLHSLFNRGMGALIKRQGEGANLPMIEFSHEFQAIRVGWEGRCRLLSWALDQV